MIYNHIFHFISEYIREFVSLSVQHCKMDELFIYFLMLNKEKTEILIAGPIIMRGRGLKLVWAPLSYNLRKELFTK